MAKIRDALRQWTVEQVALLFIAGGVMIFGDYLTSYYDGLGFFAGEVISLIGWGLFVIAL